MNNRWIVLLFLVCVVTFTAPARLHIVTTLFPLYDFARGVGQDRVEVQLLLPPGVEAHSFEPTPRDRVNISRADVFIYTGPQMEPWVAGMTKGVEQGQVVKASEGIVLAGNDPHVWLDFKNAMQMVDVIAMAIAKQDPAHQEFFKQNAKTYKLKLAKLDQDYQSWFAIHPSKTILFGGHDAFGYLARRYHLRFMAAQGFSPDSEPTAKDLVKLIQQIQQERMTTVFYEELSSPKIAQMLVQETGVKMLKLSSAHNVSKQDLAQGVTFIDLMRQNLHNLQKGLTP